jgi:hypothetical protein
MYGEIKWKLLKVLNQIHNALMDFSPSTKYNREDKKVLFKQKMWSG